VTLFFLLLATTAEAIPAASPKLDVSVQEGASLVGDSVQFTVQARGGEDLVWGDLEIEMPELGPWALVAEPRAVAGSRPPVWSLTLAPMRVGEIEAPVFTVAARTEDGRIITVEAESQPAVTIGSVLPAEGEAEPNPMRQPLGVGGFPWEWVAPITILFLPILVLGAWFFKRRRDREVAGKLVLSPVEHLERVVSELLERLSRDPNELLCDRLASGLRCYLESRSGEPAAEMTTAELRLLGRNSCWPETVRRAVLEALETADQVRFGKAVVGEGRMRSAIEAALVAGRGLEDFLTPSETDGDHGELAA
jgi:hypothetical protein